MDPRYKTKQLKRKNRMQNNTKTKIKQQQQ